MCILTRESTKRPLIVTRRLVTFYLRVRGGKELIIDLYWQRFLLYLCFYFVSLSACANHALFAADLAYIDREKSANFPNFIL